MPATSLEQVRKIEAQLKAAIAGLGDAPDEKVKRDLGKKLKRAQRRRRTLAVRAAHVAKTAAKPAAETPPAGAPPAEEA